MGKRISSVCDMQVNELIKLFIMEFSKVYCELPLNFIVKLSKQRNPREFELFKDNFKLAQSGDEYRMQRRTRMKDNNNNLNGYSIKSN